MKFNRSRLIAYILWVSGLVVVDQLVKAWARQAADHTEGRTFLTLIPNVFEFRLVYNEGVAFGMAQGAGRILTPIAVIIIGYSLWHVSRNRKEPPLVFASLVALGAGALGNLIDRLFMGGKVTDMLYIRLIDFPVFNVADMYITLAAVLIIISALRDSKPKTETPEIAPE